MLHITDYLENIESHQQLEYARIKRLVHSVVPNVSEVISYGLPTFKYKGKPLLYFGAFKNHMSVFPTPAPIDELSDKLKPYKVSKGAVQFTKQMPLTDDIILDMIRIRKDIIDSN